MYATVSLSAEDPWAGSRHAPQVCQWERGCTWVNHPGEKWLSQPSTLLVWLCCFQGLQFPPVWWGDMGSSSVSLPQHWHVLIYLNCSVCMSVLLPSCPNNPLLWSFWDYPRCCYPGRALCRWELSAWNKVWVFAVFIPIWQVLAARGFVFCSFWRESIPALIITVLIRWNLRVITANRHNLWVLQHFILSIVVCTYILSRLADIKFDRPAVS